MMFDGFRKDSEGLAWIDPTLDLPILPAEMTRKSRCFSPRHWALKTPGNMQAAEAGVFFAMAPSSLRSNTSLFCVQLPCQ